MYICLCAYMYISELSHIYTRVCINMEYTHIYGIHTYMYMRELRNKVTCLPSADFDKRAKIIQWRKNSLPINGAGTNSHMQKKKNGFGHLLHTTDRN